MYKVFIILSLLAVSKSEDPNLNWFNGRWFPAIVYPHTSWTPICEWMELTINQNPNCTCNDNPVSSVLHVYDKSTLGVVPVLVINSLAEKDDALNQDCKCNGRHEVQGVYRKINENYFVLYSKSSYSPDFAQLMLKKMPKLSELRAVVRTIEDLKDRKPGYLCDPNVYVNEFDNLN